MNEASNPAGNSSAENGAGEDRGAPVSVQELENVVIRFAGDSGDGMQLTGTQFSNAAALFGNDLATLPDYPAEIRAPVGTTAGVSGFQVHLGSTEVFTPGDRPDVLVAMNPAALKVSLPDLDRSTIIILNADTFEERSLEKAGFSTDPRTDGTLESYKVYEVPLTSVTMRALESSSLSFKERERCKNFFALGLMYWMYGRSVDYTLEWINQKFSKNPAVQEANIAALKAGYFYGETTEMFGTTYRVKAARIAPGTYRNVTGNQASAMGFVAASQLSGVELFLGSYPITPASDILHELAHYKNYGVRTFQAEDEIAAIASAIGAAYGGHLSITTSSGPGIALKTEAMGLAVMAELPLVIVDVQRGGPSTGLPTKTEQADLLQAMYGRNSESPMVVIAAASPGDCFWMALEASRIAVKYMTPVMLLTDGYIANGAEPFLLPRIEELPKFPVSFRTNPEGFFAYQRDPETMARAWVRPGTPGLEHRIGGLEKDSLTGMVSYDGHNHEKMIHTRAEKVEGIARDIAPAEVYGDTEGDVLIVGWGGTYGALKTATHRLRHTGLKVGHMHLRHINPLPENVGDVLKRFKHVVVAELNLGQLRQILRARFLVDAHGLNKVQGQPFKVSEIMARVQQIVGG